MKPIFIIIASILALTAGLGAYLAWPRPEVLLESAEMSAGRDRLRHQVFDEGGFLGGSRHVLSLRAEGAAEWRELIVFFFDGANPIRETNFRLSPVAGGYAVSLGWKLALSPGPGRPGWVSWDAGRDLPGWECCNYRLIRGISIAEDGRGRLELNPIAERAGETAYLLTEDHGRSWRAP